MGQCCSSIAYAHRLTPTYHLLPGRRFATPLTRRNAPRRGNLMPRFRGDGILCGLVSHPLPTRPDCLGALFQTLLVQPTGRNYRSHSPARPTATLACHLRELIETTP